MKNLKLTVLSALCLFAAFSLSNAQEPKPSPAASAKGTIDGVEVAIDYHQPSAKGREIMGKLVPYGKIWRTGANDATTIEFGADVKIEGKTLAKGKYSLFTIPGEKEWVVIFNKVPKQWGAYSYDEKEDALRVTVKPSKSNEFVETFNITVVSDGVEMKWENTAVKFAISK